jgi:hypothetical protein
MGRRDVLMTLYKDETNTKDVFVGRRSAVFVDRINTVFVAREAGSGTND